MYMEAKTAEDFKQIDEIERNKTPSKRTKYTKHGVKRQHQIIDGILPLLEKISKIDGIKKVNPGRISYSPKRGISQPTLKVQRQTITGFKLIAHSSSGNIYRNPKWKS